MEYRSTPTDTSPASLPHETGEEALLGIGALSKASGIPMDTLRTWERRYGFPAPHRTAGNQRLYPASTLERLFLIARALDLGHRAASVVPATADALLRLPGMTAAPDAAPQPPVPRTADDAPQPSAGWLAQWMACVQALDASGLDQELRRSWSQLGALAFLTQRTGPFLESVGESWAVGAITVAHEHFASERLRDFLAGIWAPMAVENRGPTVLCTTLPGDQHVLGLHMVACVAAMAGLRVVFLGADLPIVDIARAARQTALAVLVSVSSASDPAMASAHLSTLRRLLPQEIAILVGGKGAPGPTDGVRHVTELSALWSWASDVASQK